MAKKNRFDSVLSLKKETATEAAPNATSQKKGKRDNPDYQQISAYIRTDTYRAVKQAIVTKRDMSDLIEELLSDWLKKQ